MDGKGPIAGLDMFVRLESSCFLHAFIVGFTEKNYYIHRITAFALPVKVYELGSYARLIKIVAKHTS